MADKRGTKVDCGYDIFRKDAYFCNVFICFLMDFFTKTAITPYPHRLRHSDKLVVIGSCFAEHIGERLERMKFRTVTNPYGVLYNPLSIAEGLSWMIAHRTFTEEELQWHPDGGWNTWQHHSRYSHPDKLTALTAINQSLKAASHQLAEADALIITFGTAWVYRLKDTGSIVGNCHKEADRLFVRERLQVQEIVETYSALLRHIHDINPHLSVFFTVSPVRHLKDGLHGNQLSKATLLLAIDELCRTHPGQCHYFPAYEIIMDELRDYRFYAEDMAHPSAQAVNYVWQRFVEHCIAPEAQQFMKQWEKIVRAIEHRPFQPESTQHKQFALQTRQRIEELKEQYPYIEVDEEIARCATP